MHSSDKEWFVIENIQYDKERNKISGNCVEGAYFGEVEIYLSAYVNKPLLENGMKIKALCGPGMTMSLPPQLMGCIKIEIIA